MAVHCAGQCGLAAREGLLGWLFMRRVSVVYLGLRWCVMMGDEWLTCFLCSVLLCVVLLCFILSSGVQ